MQTKSLFCLADVSSLKKNSTSLRECPCCSTSHQDLIGVAESSFQSQRKLSDVGRDEFGLGDDGSSFIQTLLPDLPVLVLDFRHQAGRDLITERTAKR